MSRRRGFTLIELMIVIAIIAVIIAIAIPGMRRARIAANEANAIGSLRTISTAQIQYKNSGLDTTNSINQYGDLDALGTSTPPFLDSVLGTENSVKAGYVFETVIVVGTSTGAPEFEATAVAQSLNYGYRNYYVNEEGNIYWVPQQDGKPDSTDSPL
jgi:prepilin-type N-terminal cleavage/methylation domain-containing protein